MALNIIIDILVRIDWLDKQNLYASLLSHLKVTLKILTWNRPASQGYSDYANPGISSHLLVLHCFCYFSCSIFYVKNKISIPSLKGASSPISEGQIENIWLEVRMHGPSKARYVHPDLKPNISPFVPADLTQLISILSYDQWRLFWISQQKMKIQAYCTFNVGINITLLRWNGKIAPDNLKNEQ